MSRPAVLEVDRTEWRETAINYLVARCRQVGTVTADDLRRDLPTPDHHNQYGAVFTAARSRNLIVKVGAHNSMSRSRHYGDQKVWGLHPDLLRGVA